MLTVRAALLALTMAFHLPPVAQGQAQINLAHFMSTYEPYYNAQATSSRQRDTFQRLVVLLEGALQAVDLAVAEINNSTDILPNSTLSVVRTYYDDISVIANRSRRATVHPDVRWQDLIIKASSAVDQTLNQTVPVSC